MKQTLTCCCTENDAKARPTIHDHRMSGATRDLDNVDVAVVLLVAVTDGKFDQLGKGCVSFSRVSRTYSKLSVVIEAKRVDISRLCRSSMRGKKP